MQIAAILLALVTVPVITLGTLLIKTSEEAVRSSVLNNHKEIVKRASGEIELFARGAKSVLYAAAAIMGEVSSAEWKQETVLVELVLNQPVFIRVSSVDLSGKEIASSELGRESKRYYSNEVLEEIQKGKVYISQVKFLDNNNPYVTMSAPVKKDGQIAGGIIADVNLRGIWDIVDNIQIGHTGKAFLVTDKGVLIAHHDKKRVLKKENFSSYKDVQLVLSSETGAIELEDASKERWISSYAPISDLSWAIVLRQKQDEAYLFSKVMRMQAWVIIGISELLAVVVSIFMARFLVRPVKTLASRMKSVAAGDLDHKIGSRRRDEIGELIRSFNDMIEKLKRASARERLSAIGEAAAWIAHELKNSLVSIKTFIQLFPRKYKEKNFVDKFSKLIPEEIKRWENMLKELSDFSYHSDLRRQNVDVKDLLDNLLQIMGGRLLEKRISVDYNTEGDNFIIWADSERLKQVFMNLIINAVNAMADGGALRISLRSIEGSGQLADSSIEARVQDTGCGIPMEELDKIFEPFYTANKGGMGLGLSISQRIVEQHGGKIKAESKLNTGSVFTVILPKDPLLLRAV
ncbi:MAG: ATP-binding protein [Candidatus Omnitrophota bacterium]